MGAAYETVLNIGCPEGYYAVGMARHMPATRVLAFDLNPVAQQTCVVLAAKNDVAKRVQVEALFRPEDFTAFDVDPGAVTPLGSTASGTLPGAVRKPVLHNVLHEKPSSHRLRPQPQCHLGRWPGAFLRPVGACQQEPAS